MSTASTPLEKKTFYFDANQPLELWHFYDEKNKLWIKAKDAAVQLGYKNPDSAIYRHISKENKKIWKKDEIVFKLPINWHPKTLMISESGFYQLMMRSRLPTLKRFQYWMATDVLPKMKSCGKYYSDVWNNGETSVDNISDLLQVFQIVSKNKIKGRIRKIKYPERVNALKLLNNNVPQQ